MRIHSLSKVLAIPLGLILLAALYVAFELNVENAWIWLLPPLITITALFVFHGQIDFWWSSRNTPPLDQPIKDWLMKYDAYYQSLDAEQQAHYDKRMVLYMEGRAFQSVGREMHKVPNDIQGIISSVPVRMMLHKEDFLIGDMDRIFLYKHPFPSPRYQFLHTAETDHIDGVIILSMEHAIPGIMNPNEHYNITLHAYAESYLQVYSKHDTSYLDDITWAQLEQIGPFTKDQILQTLGFSDAYVSTVAVHHFFSYPNRFKAVLPEVYEGLRREFNLPGKYSY